MENSFNNAQGGNQGLSGAQQGQGNQVSNIPTVGSQIAGVTVARVDQSGRPYADISYLDQFPRNRAGQPVLPSQTRTPNYQPVTVLDVRKYVDQRGNPRVAFNQGAIHLSYNQLKSGGVFNPDSLKGKRIFVDYFRRGDVLLNGSIVTDDGRIVNRFMLEPNAEVDNKLEYDMKKESLTSWAALVGQAFGANQRGMGEGMQVNTNNGIAGANTIPQMQDPRNAAGIGRVINASPIDQRLTAGPDQANSGVNEINPLGSQTGLGAGPNLGGVQNELNSGEYHMPQHNEPLGTQSPDQGAGNQGTADQGQQ